MLKIGRSQHNADSSQRLFLVLFCLILAALCALQIIAGYSHRDPCGNAWGTDDAYISYRYSRNLFAGNGLVFNPGEKVEGFSNLLYTLLLTPAFLFTDGAGIYIYASVLNTLLLVAALILFNRLLYDQSNRFVLLADLVFITSSSLWAWTASGLETILVLLLQISIWLLVERCVNAQRVRLALPLLCAAIVLSVLTRVDGFIFPVLAILYLLVKGKRRPALLCGLALILTCLGLTVWRYGYYRDLLPNTYYAKVNGEFSDRLGYGLKLLAYLGVTQGLFPYLWSFFLQGIHELKGVLRNFRTLQKNISFELIAVIAILAYWLYIGGDVYYERFLLILIPIGIASIRKVILASQLPRMAWGIFPLLLIMNLSILATDSRFAYSLDKNDCWTALGNFLGQKYPRCLLATGAAGKIPFYSNLETIDMYGLNDRYIARGSSQPFIVGHSKYDPVYVFARQPDLITGWIDGLDLTPDMDRDQYTRAGYELNYLVYTGPTVDNHAVIVDVSRMSLAEIQSLTQQGYDYAVLTLKETAP